jgi:hypothetical protein
VRIPAAVAFGSGHEVGERNKIEVASVAVADDVDNLLLMLMSREVHGRRRVEAKNDRLNIILAKSYVSTIILSIQGAFWTQSQHHHHHASTTLTFFHKTQREAILVASVEVGWRHTNSYMPLSAATQFFLFVVESNR